MASMQDEKCLTTTPYLEHANFRVQSLDQAVRFIQAALPEFEVRGRGEKPGSQWLHIGTATSYLAIEERTDSPLDATGNARSRLNHLGFVVASVSEIKTRLLAAGFKEGFIAEEHPYRRRLYFLDDDGLEWEFVEYLSDDFGQRNEY